jgi:hypothetical protein
MIMAHSRVLEMKSLLRLFSILIKSSSGFLIREHAGSWRMVTFPRFLEPTLIVGSIKRNVKKM